MIKKCPNCIKPLELPDSSESGQYICPYDDCSKTFFFHKDTDTLHKIEQPKEETLEDEIIVTCPNPACEQKLRIPSATTTLQVTCPKCRTSFEYPAQDEGAAHDIRGLLAEFDKALEDEIKAVKTRGGNRILTLKDGKFIGEIARERVYQFSVERKVPVADETPAQIEIMGRNYRASIVRFLELKLEVRITGFDGEQIPFALLKIDATYVLRKLKEALPFLSYRPKSVNLPLKVFNQISPECAIGNPVFTLMDKTGEGPDDFQETAIKACLGNEVSFIHGPPGTGKTRTLVNVVNDFANNGKKVLVTCHTNIACDNIIEHFIRFEHEEIVGNLLNSGEIIRIGTPVLQDARVKSFTIDAVYEHLSEELEKEKERLTKLTNSLTEKNRRYYEYKQIFLECENARERMASCGENISASKRIVEQCTQEEDELKRIICEKNELLSIAEKRNAIINFFKGTRPKNLRLVIKYLNNQKTKRINDRLKEEERLRLLLGQLDKLKFFHSEKVGGLPERINVEQIESVLKETEITLEETRAKIVGIDDKISKLNEGVLNNAKIVVSTLAKTFTDPVLMEMQFDVVVVDEASIAPLPMLFYVCSLSKQKVLIFGDPNQLAPIKLADTIAARRWLETDIFQEANAEKERPYDARISSLNNQYRMHGEIFEIVNNKFYKGKLRDRRPQIDKEYNRYDNLIPNAENRVIVIDTSNANACISTEKTGPRSSSRYNLYHTQIVERILHDLIDGNYIEQKDVGIIAPYRSQANFMREALRDLGFKDVDLGTVHSFQGIERKYIIFDLVEAPGGKKIGVLVNDKHEKYKGKKQSENNAQRLFTVAFSRPREKLLIISHNKHMLSNLPGNSVIRKIIAELIDREAIIDGAGLVPFYVPADEYQDATLYSEEELIGKEAVFNQRSFYPHLIRDLKTAEKEVIFISGYMSTNRIEKLIPHITDLLSKGVSITIITKPPREQKSRQDELEELHQRLSNMGLEVLQHYGVHEKIAAIDGHILYAGSLNALSFDHRSNEMMIRTDSKSKLQKVFSVVAKNYPRLKDYLVKSGYTVPDEVVDLTPEKFQNILDEVRPKRREIPENKQEAKEYYRSMLKKLRWVIADDKRIPIMAILHNVTIEAMLSDPPTTVDELLTLAEFRRNRTNIRGYESVVLEILKEYRKDG